MSTRPMGARRIGCVRCIRYIGVALVALALVAAGTVASAPVSRAWHPLVLFAGGGDARRAVQYLRDVTEVSELRLTRLNMDAATRGVIDKFWAGLRDFAVDDVHDMLPRRDGAWRRFDIEGYATPEEYRIQQPAAGSDFEVRRGGRRRALGDYSAVVRLRPVQDRTDADDENFLLEGRVGIGVGAVGRAQVAAAAHDALRLVDGSQLPVPSNSLRTHFAKYHAPLDADDERVLGLAYESFPALAALSERFGRVDNITVPRGDPAGRYHHVLAGFTVDPKRMATHYPDLADFLADLDDLAEAKVELTDARGRRVGLMRMTTRTLQGSVEFFAQDGHIVPSSRAKDKTTVHVAAPILLDAAHSFHAYATTRFELMGVNVTLGRLHARVDYAPEGRDLRVRIAARRVPAIRVAGAGLGFVPTGLIDALIPSDMETLTRKFLATALQGNGGQGLVLELTHEQPAPDAAATTRVELGVELLDSLLVKLGARMVSDRLMPDEASSADFDRAMADAHAAFRADLDRFGSTLRP